MIDPLISARAGLLLVVIGAIAGATRAQAEPIESRAGYQLAICESAELLAQPNNRAIKILAAWQTAHDLELARSAPSFRLKNTSTTGEIARFRLELGEAGAYFDSSQVDVRSPGVDVKISLAGEPGSSSLELCFSGFDPGEFVQFSLGLAPVEGVYALPDYRMSLFQANGDDPSDNALFSVDLEDTGPTGDTSFSQKLPDFEVAGPLFVGPSIHKCPDDFVVPFVVGDDLVPIPEPASYLLLILGLCSAIAFRKRRF